MNIIVRTDEMRQLAFDGVVLRLTKREETKIIELPQCFASDSAFDSVHKVTSFTSEQHIKGRCIMSDDALVKNGKVA